jgi:mono/diheme cytochrome c family protein
MGARSTVENPLPGPTSRVPASRHEGWRVLFGRASRRLLASAVLASLSLVACNPGQYPVDIFPEMHYQPNHRRLQPQRLYPAPDAVPVTGARPRYTFAQTRNLANPVQRGGDTTRQAQQLYAINCATCHGQTGRGDGPVAKYFRDDPTSPVPPADFTSDRVTSRSDGELYWLVANGEGNMPAFGDELTERELWMAVTAIRGMAG